MLAERPPHLKAGRGLIILVVVFLTCFLISVSSFPVLSQTPVKVFEAISRTDHVMLRWVLQAGFTCQGIRIQHSSDGQFFQIIGEIPGICGSPDTDQIFFYHDSLALPFQTNYYRLELGSSGYSKVISVNFVPVEKEGYRVVFDASHSRVSIHLDNSQSHQIFYDVFSSAGKLLFSGSTDNETISFHTTKFDSQFGVVLLRYPDRAFAVKVPTFR